MSRPTQDKVDRELADLVENRYLASAMQRQPRVDEWDKAYDNVNPSFIDRQAVRRPPYVKFPYLWRVASQQRTILLDAMDANGVWVMAQGLTPENQKHGEVVTQFLENNYRAKSSDIHINNRAALKRVAWMGLLYGNSYVMAEWERRADWWGVRYHSLDPYDVYMDGTHGRFYIIRRVVTLNQLGVLASTLSAPEIRTDNVDGKLVETVVKESRDDNRALKAFRKVQKDIKAGQEPVGYLYDPGNFAHGNSRRHRNNRIDGVDDDRTDGHVSAKDDPFNAPIAILEYYETDSDGMVAKVIPAFGKSGESLVLQRQKNPHGCCPIIPFTPHPIDNEYYGFGLGEIVGKLADAMDYNLRGMLSIIGAHAWAPIFVTRSSQLRRHFFRSVYGKSFEVPTMNDIPQFMQPPPTGGMHQIGQEVAKQAANFATGESDQRQGQPAKGVGTATEAAILETAGNITDREVFSQWKDTIEQVGKATLMIARVHMTRTESIPLLGRNSQHFWELNPQFMSGQWAVTFGGNPRGAGTQQMIAQDLNIAQSFAQSGELNIRESLRSVLMLTGRRDVNRFLMRPDPPPPVSPAQEHTDLFEAGRAPEISPGENMEQHLREHATTLNEWVQTLGPQDHRVVTLHQHAQLTEQAFMAQFAAQAQGQNGGGTPSLFNPAQAGQPGQPASAQGAFDGLDAQRQTSNDQAGGGAPGGTVPGRSVGSVLGNGGAR